VSRKVTEILKKSIEEQEAASVINISYQNEFNLQVYLQDKKTSASVKWDDINTNILLEHLAVKILKIYSS